MFWLNIIWAALEDRKGIVVASNAGRGDCACSRTWQEFLLRGCSRRMSKRILGSLYLYSCALHKWNFFLSPDLSSDVFFCFQDVQHRWWRLIGVEGKASMCSWNPVPLWRSRVKLQWHSILGANVSDGSFPGFACLPGFACCSRCKAERL